jgi:hypothetical protein
VDWQFGFIAAFRNRKTIRVASLRHFPTPCLVSTIPLPAEFRVEAILLLLPGQMISADEQSTVIATLYALAMMILTSGQILCRASMIVGCRCDFSLGKGVSRQASSDFFRRF